ncbi:MAG: hypothetical protein HRT81_02935 [Henriciella sp.]|nr:hypothetical protein [Henriciella sp.]
MKNYILSLTLLCGIAPSASATPPLNPYLTWMSGCWTSESSDYREVWSTDEGSYLFGYALSYDANGAVVFFEQMRIDLFPNDTLIQTFNAYPKGIGPSSFVRTEWDQALITFENAEHDYPQRIKYFATGNGLGAEISLIDGSQARRFEFVRCASN